MNLGSERMSNIHLIAEKIRQEPFHVFSIRNNCIGKSFRFRRACRRVGIDARMVVSIGFVYNKRFKMLPPMMLAIHGWAEVKGRKIELIRTSSGLSPWGISLSGEKPLIAIWI